MEFGDHWIPEEHIIKKTKYCFVFVNIRPFLPYHLLVSPIRKEGRLNGLSSEEYIDLMSLLKLTTTSLDSLGTSWTVILQDGEDAGQTVQHVHFHVIPRTKGDLSRNNDIYNKINVDVKRPDRNFEEMKEEANFLRSFFKENTTI
ncbi:uncharacterized protein VICG_00006 [Vittaforma corneae ATCC 50505]|uniref:HIT domain-containing protein n=1 Tax=Vittaforma corneae (strain ATCC 50505) TaxID=993615 RepID=L2GPD9_VITCO|nr:uncharacterized protein VICG_00006 [Vittaforma corneae ATCC 50505]ELA42691.1 hypothetical protein VICG_00006 [Vittaforma corneae ATCC 50505]